MFNKEPQRINKIMKEPLRDGEYMAIAIEYLGFKNKKGGWNLAIIFDIDEWKGDPYRHWHFVKSNWYPTMLIANAVGFATGDKLLQTLTAKDMNELAARFADVRAQLNFPCNVIVKNGQYGLDIVGVIARRDVEKPAWAVMKDMMKTDDVPFDEPKERLSVEERGVPTEDTPF